MPLWLSLLMFRTAPALAALAGLPLLAACADMPGLSDPTPAQAPVVVAVAPPPPPPPVEARTVEEFDTTTAEDRAAALSSATAGGETELGRTIASLGSPTEPGIWIETPLVTVATMGRVAYPAAGTEIALELRPSGGVAGSGSEISLAAMRLLEIPLTALAEVIVYAPGG